MHRASLGGPGSGLRDQSRGLELEVVQAGDVHLQGWMGAEGEADVSTPPAPPPPSSLRKQTSVGPNVRGGGPQASPSPFSCSSTSVCPEDTSTRASCSSLPCKCFRTS